MNKQTLFIIFLALLLLPPGLSAQSGKGKNGGTVLDKSSNPIIGATVQNKDNGSWAITDEKGEFFLDGLSKGNTLLIACIGYADQSVVYDGGVIKVVLEEEALELDEAVAIGYGSARKKDLTGSVSVLGNGVLEQQSTMLLSQSLAGTVPGLVVQRSNTMPGSSASMTIRGITTMSDNNPLILVDGMAVSSIDSVAPDDVEQITVLKDGASASIYGARAAAGVILITTKGAKEGDMSIVYKGEYSVIQPTEWQEYITDPVSYMTMFNEYKWNDAGNDPASEFSVYSEDYIASYMENHKKDPITYPDFDWKSYMLKKVASRHKHNISMNYGNKVVKTRISANYENDDAIFEGGRFAKLNTRVRNSFNISKYVSGDMDLAFNHSDKDWPSFTPVRAANMYPRLFAGLYPDGRYALGKNGSNAVASLKGGGSVNTASSWVTGKVSLTFKPFDGFSITGSVTPTYSFTKKKDFNKAIPLYDAYDENVQWGWVANHKTNDLTETRNDYFILETQFVANYETRIANAHSINAMAGYEDYSYTYETESASATNLTLADFPYLDLATYDAENGKVLTTGGNSYGNAYRSFFGRLMYNYKGRYYAQVNARADASSRFHKDYRWGFFPSASLGWVLTEEPFMKNVKVLDYFKLRASVGTLGNERIGNYPYQATVDFVTSIMFDASGAKGSQQIGATQREYAVKDISWETTYTYDVGFDAMLLDNRLSITADYYYKKTTDMLLEINIPSYSGYTNPERNGGMMYTNGWEFRIDWKDSIGDFHYGASFNLSDYLSIMGDLKGTTFPGSKIIMEGEEYNAWYGYKSLGIFQNREDIISADTQLITSISPGDIGYYDLDGPDGEKDGMVNAAYDRTVLGSSLPHFVYGGNLSAGWKNWNLSVLFNGVGKQLSLLDPYMVQAFSGQWLSPAGCLKNADGSRNYWSVYNTEDQNRKAQYPRLSESSADVNNYVTSDFWLIDGSYLRIKNINLSYSVPSRLLKSINIKGLKTYLSIDDAFCFNKFLKGWDPEQSSDNAYIARTWTIGVDLKF